jgi:glucan 1,3-beta-glucosidase
MACISCWIYMPHPVARMDLTTGGILNVCEWHTQEEYINYALHILERLAERYNSRSALHAIEVLNEPAGISTRPC